MAKKETEILDIPKISLILLKKSENDNNFLLIALFNNKQVGYSQFSFDKSICKLNRIAITKKEFLGKGIGSLLFNQMEYWAHQNNMNEISGIFIPRGYDDAWQRTSKFYERQNMKTYGADFEYNDRDEIYKAISPKDGEQKFDIIIDANIYSKFFKYNNEINDLFSSRRCEDAMEPTL